MLSLRRERATDYRRMSCIIVRAFSIFAWSPCERGSGEGGTALREPVRRLGCRCSECQAVVLGDLADFLGGELGGVCDDPERYAALEQFQRDFFHGVVFSVFFGDF